MAKIVYVTSQCPFGNAEIWTIGEMSALIDAGMELIIVPRTASGEVRHEGGRRLLPFTLNIPLINIHIILNFIITFLIKPFLVISIINWIKTQSNNWIDFIKGLAVLPKSLFAAKILKYQNVSHVHAHSTTTVAVVAYVLARILNVPWSFTLHSSYIVHNGFRRSLTAQLNSARFMRVISKKIADAILLFMGNEFSSKVKVIHLGVPCSAKSRENSIRKRPFIIATPGVLLPHKGHEFALKACRLLLERGVSDFIWYFYGDGQLHSSLANQIRDMQLSNVITLAGMIDNTALLRSYSEGRVDVIVLPSIEINGIHEGIPVSLMEAMAFGIPVIATDCGGISELIGDGAGIMVPQRDEASIVRAILQLMNDKVFFSTQGLLGMSKVSEDFNLSKVAHQLKNTFNSSM